MLFTDHTVYLPPKIRLVHVVDIPTTVVHRPFCQSLDKVVFTNRCDKPYGIELTVRCCT